MKRTSKLNGLTMPQRETAKRLYARLLTLCFGNSENKTGFNDYFVTAEPAIKIDYYGSNGIVWDNFLKDNYLEDYFVRKVDTRRDWRNQHTKWLIKADMLDDVVAIVESLEKTKTEPQAADDELELLELEAEALEMELTMAAPQTGYPERAGDVTKEQLKNAFALRSVKTSHDLSDSEIQQLLNISYDTFRHLAMVIGQPMTAVGLGGNLALNIGIMQMGGRTGGCYEPHIRSLQFKTNENFKHIAHEWLHAFDHYLWYTFGKVRNNPDEMMSDKQQWADGASDNTKHVWERLIDAVDTSDYQKRSAAVAELLRDDYWKTEHEMLARAFEIYTTEKLLDLDIVNTHLVSLFPNNPYPKPRNSASDLRIMSMFDLLFENLKLKKTNYEIESLFGNY